MHVVSAGKKPRAQRKDAACFHVAMPVPSVLLVLMLSMANSGRYTCIELITTTYMH